MIQPITKERWQQAQIAEAGYHIDAEEENYWRSYQIYFRYLGMDFNQCGKVIAEVGTGPFPALGFCEMVHGNIFEPLFFPRIEALVLNRGMHWYREPIEDVQNLPNCDEAWLLNCLQHVRDPEIVVEKCKQIAPVIRFFEPIDFGTSDCHPHTYSIDDFIRWFGHAERYKGGSDEGFHTADCAYGTWRSG